jgi:hypothetical protein
MKHSDKYPPGTVEDARNLPVQPKVFGLHPLVWGMIAVFCIAAVGMYSEMVGFYDHIEDIVEGEHEDEPDNGDRLTSDGKPHKDD